MPCTKPHARNLRKGRYSRTGDYYFLTTSVFGRREIFTTEERATVVLETIRWLHIKNRFLVDAAVVMPDHLHFVGQLVNGTLSNVMHTLKSYTSNRLAQTGIPTPIWQEGYYDHGLRGDEDYRTRVRYVLQNPLRKGLAQRVEDYPYMILPEWWDVSVQIDG